MKTSQPKPSGAIALRHAQTADVPAIVHMLWDDEQGRQRETISQDQANTYLSAFEQIERDPNSQVLVATLEDTVIGSLQLTVIPGLSYQGVKRALVEDLRVAQSNRGQGVGRQLLAYAEAMATDLGCDLLELFVHGSRDGAHRFYERAGYTGAHRGFRKNLRPA
ncbi:Ribosomal protein S18 acetylase RimI [Ruegeria halocynthiae]|uniref:Ribosomal protein S18 acetylase RimI n=1 Tax=Ruegeria halocynthiae TaxID=985054 RepID=A0A1H3FLN8_9RHOB|nr:GNAT family N-acetyltransferase [Ruegeria halocynthiae]SDX91707.1 Ribosomal protein S18 acetylase RimI [Ruegeria halocynthiae]